MQFKYKYGFSLARSINVSMVLLSKTFLFQAIQFDKTIQSIISMASVLFNP